MIQIHSPKIFVSTRDKTTPDGSTYRLYLSEPIEVPREAFNASVSVMNATFWFNFPNIIGKAWHVRLDGVYYTTAIPDGLYGLGELAASLSRFLTNLQADPERITISGDDATQKILFTFNGDPDDELLFVDESSLYRILGVDLGTIISPAATPEIISAANTAQFNSVNSVTFKTNIIRGIPKNGLFDGTIVQIPLTVFPGSQQTYEPPIKFEIPSPELIGRKVHDVELRICDENGEVVNTLGETFSVSLNISYYIYPPPRTVRNINVDV